jgi:hypothetical protein
MRVVLVGAGRGRKSMTLYEQLAQAAMKYVAARAEARRGVLNLVARIKEDLPGYLECRPENVHYIHLRDAGGDHHKGFRTPHLTEPLVILEGREAHFAIGIHLSQGNYDVAFQVKRHEEGHELRFGGFDGQHSQVIEPGEPIHIARDADLTPLFEQMVAFIIHRFDELSERYA